MRNSIQEADSVREAIMHLMAICSLKMHEALQRHDADYACAFYARRSELAGELRRLPLGQRAHQIGKRYGELIDDYNGQRDTARPSLFEIETLARSGQHMALAG